MNLYILLRLIFYSLLVVNNLLALMAAAWSISASGASPGALLVILGCVAFVVLGTITWAEVCAPQTQLSRARTEAALVPMLIAFQLIGAAVVTSNTIKSVCRDPTSCVALVVLSWLTPFSLLAYYLMVLAITFDHAKVDSSIWNASFLDHPWFVRSPPLPPKDDIVGPHSHITPPLSLGVQPSVIDHESRRSIWTPASLWTPSLNKPQLTNHTSRHDSQGYSKCSFLPRWARDLKPLQRGKELPFPVATPHRRYSDPRRIDAPVLPTIYTEYV